MVSIIKASGDVVPYEAAKLRMSLLRIGVDEKLIKKVLREVSEALVENMTTHEIYRIAFKILRKDSKYLAAKYHLKKAIMQLGTSGYPFEKYVAALIKRKGFSIENNRYLQGHCVNHEVDVVAKRNDKFVIVECKYHNRANLKCDVKVALYFKARVDDIIQKMRKLHPTHIEGWLVTNTRFTKDALQYGVCAGLHMVSWDHPSRDNLKEMIEFTGLYPITCITNLTRDEISRLLSENIVLCKSITCNPSLLDDLRISEVRKTSIIQQCRELATEL